MMRDLKNSPSIFNSIVLSVAWAVNKRVDWVNSSMSPKYDPLGKDLKVIFLWSSPETLPWRTR